MLTVNTLFVILSCGYNNKPIPNEYNQLRHNNMKPLKFLLATSMIAGMSLTSNADAYKATAKLSEEEDGAMAYLINYDTGDKIDSVTVNDQNATFVGNIKEPAVVRLTIDGDRYGQFILEPGELTFDVKTQTVEGGPLNKTFTQFSNQAGELAQKFRSATTNADKEAILGEYNTLIAKYMKENINNPIGYILFIQSAYDMSPAELEATVDATPSLKSYKRVQKLIEANKNKAATQPGNKFADFEIEYDGVKHRLSDVVGKGDYVLVDFWASWCGPCIRQTAVIKDIYNEYKDKGLKVLGVAVWDEPDKTKEAIKSHDLPWECWFNGQNIPTDIYGISGIPCIILFGPDGTIISRDKQDDDLKADVAAAMNK